MACLCIGMGKLLKWHLKGKTCMDSTGQPHYNAIFGSMKTECVISENNHFGAMTVDRVILKTAL